MIARQGRRDLRDMRQGMGGLEGRNNPLLPAAQLERVQSLVVGDRDVLYAPHIVQPRMLGADAGIIEASRNRVGVVDLAVIVLQQVGAVAMQYAGETAVQRGGVKPG